MPDRSDCWFKTKCGRDVLLERIHIRPFAHGFLEGRATLIREQVLSEIPETAQRIFPGTTGLFIEELDGPPDKFPAFIYFCDFTCFSPINSQADCSSLTACWFGDDLHEPIPQFIAPRIARVDWAVHAKDGYW